MKLSTKKPINLSPYARSIVKSSSRNGHDILKKLAIHHQEITHLNFFSCIYMCTACFHTCQCYNKSITLENIPPQRREVVLTRG